MSPGRQEAHRRLVPLKTVKSKSALPRSRVASRIQSASFTASEAVNSDFVDGAPKIEVCTISLDTNRLSLEYGVVELAAPLIKGSINVKATEPLESMS